jgi:hypothetical protein
MDLIVGLISLACISTGLLVGLLLQNFLPRHHLDAASKDAVKIGAGMLATLTALVLGLLVSSSKSSFDAINTAIASGGAKIIMFDRILANYGPETNDVRYQLRQSVADSIDRIWSSNKTSPGGLRAAESGTGVWMIQTKLNQLTGTDSRAGPSACERRCTDPSSGDRAATKFAARVIPYPSDLLARGSLFQFWTVCSAECHGARGITLLRLISLLCHLSGS